MQKTPVLGLSPSFADSMALLCTKPSVSNAPLTTDAHATQESRRGSFTRGGGWQTLLVLALLVFLLPIGKLFLPLLLLALLGVAVYGYIRGAFYIGRRTGYVAITLLIAVVASTFVIQFRAYQSHTEFVQSLSQFNTVSVQTHSVLPSAPIQQVSLKKDIGDAELATLIAMPELQNVSDVYLQYCDVTDSGLRLIDGWPKLRYLYIESGVISDSAIVDFIDQHPDCSVIPPGRDLW